MTWSNERMTWLRAATSVCCTEPRTALITWSTSVAGRVRLMGISVPEGICGPLPGSERSMNFLPSSVRRRIDAPVPRESLMPLLISNVMRTAWGSRFTDEILPTSIPATRTGSPVPMSLASLNTAVME